MKVLVANLPWREAGRFGIRAGSRWPHLVEELRPGDTVPYPFFLGYAAALLRDGGHAVTFRDSIARGENEAELLAVLRAGPPELLLTETATPSFYHDVALLSKIAAFLPEMRIVLAGPHATVYAPEILRAYSFIHACLLGEYEENALALADHLDGKRRLESLRGIVLKAGGGLYHNREPRPIELDLLPLPWRDESLAGYNDWFCRERPNVQLMATRGCPFGCEFCLWPQTLFGGRTYRTRSLDRVLAEIRSLRDHGSAREFYFDDDSINADRDWFKRFCRALAGERVTWSAMANTLTIDRETIELLRAGGCEGLKLGVESATVAVRKTELGRTREVFRALREAGIRVHGTFVIGFPDENRDQAAATLRLIGELRPDTFQVSCLIPFPGTAVHARLQREGKLDPDWRRYVGTFDSPILNPNFREGELAAMMREAYRQWRMR